MNRVVLTVVLLSLSACSATYNLKDSWSGGAIFDNFNYFTGSDPTHGISYFCFKINKHFSNNIK
jgi:hypothetical protein